jgi:hypothetical protein
MRNSIWILFTIVCSLSVGEQILSAQTIVLQPGNTGKDTYVCDCLPNVNNPNGPTTVLYQGQYGKCFDRILIQWDISSLPKDANIVSAIMEMKVNGIYGTLADSGKLVYYRMTENWEEDNVTCATIPHYAKVDSIVTSWPRSGQWHSVDITTFVQKWYQDTTSNHGIYGFCYGTTGQCDVEFSSSDASSSSNRPKLTITYTLATKVELINTSKPLNFQLDQNYPNPFNPTTKIHYSIPRSEFVSLKVFDLLGKEVITLVNQNQDAGNYETLFNSGHLTSGIYLYQLQAGNFCDVKKLILLK